MTRVGALRKAFLAAALTVLGLEVLAHTGVLARTALAPLPAAPLLLPAAAMAGMDECDHGWLDRHLLRLRFSYASSGLPGKLRSIQDLRTYLWILIAFGTFIVACGATHLMELVTVWWPVYPLSAAVKVLCAAASVPTAILFVRAAPGLATNIRHFLQMLSTTQQEKDQAVGALLASEKLVVAGRISASISHEIKNPLETAGNLLYLLSADPRMPSRPCGVDQDGIRQN